MNAQNTTPAVTEVKTDELGLSDTELDTVSGGVNPGIVLASIFTFGIACGAVSLIEAVSHKDCGEALSR